MERDLIPANFTDKDYISTHTLTWSVTRDLDEEEIDKNFNSHAHVERDFCIPASTMALAHFNSHAHVERDSHLFIDVS